MKYIFCVVLLSLSISSCVDSARSRRRKLEPLTPDQNGSKCTEQLTSDLSSLREICDIKHSIWQNYDLFISCLGEVQSFQTDYPDFNCKYKNKKQSLKDIENYKQDIEKILYQYKSGKCGLEVIAKFNDLYLDVDSNDVISLKTLISDLDDFADRYFGINCQAKAQDLRQSQRPGDMVLSRRLINQIISRIKTKVSQLQQTNTTL